MEAKLIKVGNSKGIIIPSKFLKLLGFEDKVDIQLEEEKLTIYPQQKQPRAGWAEAIKKELEANPEQERLMPDFFEDETLEDWTW